MEQNRQGWSGTRLRCPHPETSTSLPQGIAFCSRYGHDLKPCDPNQTQSNKQTRSGVKESSSSPRLGCLTFAPIQPANQVQVESPIIKPVQSTAQELPRSTTSYEPRGRGLKRHRLESPGVERYTSELPSQQTCTSPPPEIPSRSRYEHEIKPSDPNQTQGKGQTQSRVCESSASPRLAAPPSPPTNSQTEATSPTFSHLPVRATWPTFEHSPLCESCWFCPPCCIQCLLASRSRNERRGLCGMARRLVAEESATNSGRALRDMSVGAALAQLRRAAMLSTCPVGPRLVLCAGREVAETLQKSIN